jgi:hypothetical protein
MYSYALKLFASSFVYLIKSVEVRCGLMEAFILVNHSVRQSRSLAKWSSPHFDTGGKRLFLGPCSLQY